MFKWLNFPWLIQPYNFQTPCPWHLPPSVQTRRSILSVEISTLKPGIRLILNVEISTPKPGPSSEYRTCYNMSQKSLEVTGIEQSAGVPWYRLLWSEDQVESGAGLWIKHWVHELCHTGLWIKPWVYKLYHSFKVRVITGDGLEYEELQSLIDFKSVAAYLNSFNFFSVLVVFYDQVEP